MQRLTKVILMAVSLITLPALIFGQSIFKISDGENKIDDALYQAQANDIIELTENGGFYHEFFTAEINIPLTIRAAEGLEVKPIWYCDDPFSIITLFEDLTLEGITFIGSWGDNPTEKGIVTDSAETKLGYNLIVDNCDFINFNLFPNWNGGDDAAGRAISGDPYTQADFVSITNCYFKNIGDRAIYFKEGQIAPGSAKSIIIENSTFWNIGEETIYVTDEDSDSQTLSPAFLVNHVTIHNPGQSDPDIKVIYPKYIDGAIIKNSVVSADQEIIAVSARIYNTNSAVLWFMDFNTDDVSLKDGATMDDTSDANYLENINPEYFDAENGDFTYNENSPAIGFGEDETTLGDSKWFERDRVTIDGRLGDWPEWTKIAENSVNDPALNDTTEIKAVWFTYDDNKIAMRADFFGPCDWRGGGTTSPWNINSGAMRIYFYDPIGNKWRIRMYQNSIDSSFTEAKLMLEAGPDFPDIDTGRIKGLAQWNDAGTSVELFFPSDSLTFPTSQWDPDSTVQFRFWVLSDWGPTTSRMPADGSYYTLKLSEVDYNNPSTAIDDKGLSGYGPYSYKLYQNFPNPFNPLTTIAYDVPKASKVKLTIYNIIGQKMMTLVDEKLNTGHYTVVWNSKDSGVTNVASGIYFYKIQIGDFIAVRKFILMK